MGKGSKKGNKWTAGAVFADLIFHIFISQLCEKRLQCSTVNQIK